MDPGSTPAAAAHAVAAASPTAHRTGSIVGVLSTAWRPGLWHGQQEYRVLPKARQMTRRSKSDAQLQCSNWGGPSQTPEGWMPGKRSQGDGAPQG